MATAEELGLEVGIAGFREFMRQMGQMDDAIDEQGKSWGGLSGVAGKAGGVLKGVATVGIAAVAAGAAAAVAGVAALGGAIVKLTLDAAEVEGTRRTFDTLWESIGETGPRALEAMREATSGMVADTDLMLASNKFVSMGLAETTEEAAALAEMAVQLGVSMGEDAAGSMENFALLLANQSIPRLDSFGISSGRVRERINELMEETEGMTREAAFMQAVMEQGAVTMERVGDQSGSMTGTMAQMKASFENTKLEIGQAFLPVMAQLMGVANELWQKIGPQVVAWAERLAEWMGKNLPIAIEASRKWVKEELIPALIQIWEFIQSNVIPIIQEVAAWIGKHFPIAMEAARAFIQDIFLPAWQIFIAYITEIVIPALTLIWEWLSENLPPALQKLSDFWTNVLLPAIEDVWAFIQNDLVPLFVALWELIEVAGDVAIRALTGIWQNVLLPALTEVWEWIDANLMPTLTDLWLLIKDKVTPIFEGAGDAIKDISGAVQKAIEWIVNLKEKLRNIVLPSWMEPGSPPPLYYALTDIAGAMRAVSAEAVRMNPALQGISLRGGGGVTTNNNVQNVNNFNLTTQSMTREGGLRLEFEAMGMATR